MNDEFRIEIRHRRKEFRLATNVAKAVNEKVLHADRAEHMGPAVIGRKRHTQHLRAELLKPQCKPPALETGVAGQQHPAARKGYSQPIGVKADLRH